MRMGLGLGLTQPQGSFNPAALFADGGNGILWDFTAPGPLFTDDAGTTPLTTAAQTIGMVRDGSRARSPATAYAGVQASAGLRPPYGIAPSSRRQLLTYSEQFGNGVWSKEATTVTANADVAPDGTATAGRLLETATTATHAISPTITAIATSHCYSVYLKKGSGATAPDWVQLSFGGTSSGYGNFNLSSGAVGVTSGATSAISSAGSGWYKCSLISTPSAGALSVQIIFTNNTDSATRRPSYAGAVTSDVLIWGAQLELAATATAYQKSVTALEITETGFATYGYTRPDLSDDILSTVLTLAQTGDVAIFGRTASKLEAGLVYGAGSTFSMGATTVTGMTAGVLASVGDVLGLVAIGRTLTSTERANLLTYFQARGAGAYI